MLDAAAPVDPPAAGGAAAAGGGAVAGGPTITIHVDQPGTGNDRDPFEGLDPGHVFITLEDGKGNKTTVGFYPKDKFGLDDFRNGTLFDPRDGVIKDDSTHPYEVSKTFPISQEQHDKVRDRIEKDKKDPPKYDLDEHACPHWPLDILDDIGIDIKTKDDPFPFGGKDGISPGGLGEDLEDQGGTRKP